MWPGSMSSCSDLKFVAALKELGLKPDVSDFPSRLVLQKKVYLAQWCGLNLGLRYGWYIKGPYSTDVSHAAYRLQSIFDNDGLKKVLPSFSRRKKEKASRSRRLFEAIDKLGRDKAYWYELVASVAFLRASNHLADRRISSFLRDEKPDMKKKDISKAIEVLNDFERE